MILHKPLHRSYDLIAIYENYRRVKFDDLSLKACKKYYTVKK